MERRKITVDKEETNMDIRKAIEYLLLDNIFYKTSQGKSTDNNYKLLLGVHNKIANGTKPSPKELQDLLKYVDKFEEINETILSTKFNRINQKSIKTYTVDVTTTVREYAEKNM